MKELIISETTHIKNINTILEKELLEDEEVKYELTFHNPAYFFPSGSSQEKNVMHARRFRCIATNKRLIFVGYDEFSKNIDGLRLFDYSEIKKVRFGKLVEDVYFKFNDGKYFELLMVYNIDIEDEVKNVREASEYIKGKIA